MKTRVQTELDSVELEIAQVQEQLQTIRANLGVLAPLYIQARLGDVKAREEHNRLVAEEQHLSRHGFDLQNRRTEVLDRFSEERRQLEALRVLRSTEQQTSVGGILTQRGVALPLSGTVDEQLAQVRALMAEHQAERQAIRDAQQALYDRANNGDKRAIEKYNSLVDAENGMAAHGFALQQMFSRLTIELSEQRALQRMNAAFTRV